METVKEKLAKYKAIMNSVCESCNDTCDFDCAIDCLECELEKRGLFSQYATDTNVGDKWVSVDEPPVARPLEEWHEDYGDVLWWKFPIEEPPYVGSPLCSDWPEYHTHWTPLPPCPEPPKGVQ